MKSRPFPVAITLAILLALSVGLSTAQGLGPAGSASPDAQVGTVFTYQGELKKDGFPVNDTCTMAFRLYDAGVAGDLVAAPITMSVAIADGLFTAALDFGSVFRGDARWLEVAVQCPGDAGFSTLTPRQELTAAPYALSLRPGAHVQGDTGNALTVVNTRAVGYAVGVYGSTDAPGATGSLPLPSAGVRGGATSGSGPAYGVYGSSASSDGIGVYGLAYSSTGETYGVYGKAAAPTSRGVMGTAPYIGLYGHSTASSGYTFGMYAQADSDGGYGVYGWVPAASGYTCGVYGQADSTAGRGVYGKAFASTGTTIGVYGKADSPDGYGVYYTGGLGGTGLKTSLVETPDYGWRRLYSVESTGPWFEDFGSGQLEYGQATVAIDPVFAQTVNLSTDYRVFLTPRGDCNGLYVAGATASSFDVRELGGGRSSVAFDYRIVARRLGYENVRLENVVPPPLLEAEPVANGE